MTTGQLAGEYVLLVDDDPDLRRTAAEALRREGAAVTEAGGGVEAIGLVRSGRYDAILTDLHMPRGDGYSLIGGIPPCLRSRVVVVTDCPAMLNGAGGASAFGVRFVLPRPHSVPAMIRATMLAVAAGRCGCDGCDFADACPVRSKGGIRPSAAGGAVLLSVTVA